MPTDLQGWKLVSRGGWKLVEEGERIPGMERLGGLPPAARAPLPLGLLSPEQKTMRRIAQGGPTLPQGPLATFYQEEEGEAEPSELATGIARLAGPMQAAARARTPTGAPMTEPEFREGVGGAVQVLRGGMEAASPAMGVLIGAGLGANAAKTIGSLVTYGASQAAVEAALVKAGLKPEYAQAVSELLGLGAGGAVAARKPKAPKPDTWLPWATERGTPPQTGLEPLVPQSGTRVGPPVAAEALARPPVIPEVAEAARPVARGSTPLSARVQPPETRKLPGPWQPPSTAAEAAEVLVPPGERQPIFKSAEESATKIARTLETREAQAAAKAEKKAVTVPETGLPEQVSRAMDMRQRIAKETTGKNWEELTNSERIAVDDLIAEGYTGAPKGPATPVSAARARKQRGSIPITPEDAERIRKTTKNVGQGISGFYNLDRLNIPPAGRAAIEREMEGFGDLLEKTVGRTLTHREVLDTAQQMSEMQAGVITREQTLQREAAQLKLRQSIADMAKTGKIADPQKFMEYWITDKSIGEDAARMLESRKIGADPFQGTLIDAMLTGIRKSGAEADKVASAMRGVDFNDPKQATKFFREFVHPRLEDWIDLIRYNSMLTSPRTHLVNTASNLYGTAVLAVGEKALAGGADAIRSVLTGTPRRRFAGEAGAYAKGYIGNLEQARSNFLDVMRGNKLSEYPDVNQRVPLTTKGIPRLIERTLRGPSTDLLEATDQFFTALTAAGERESLKYRQRKGVEVTDLEKQASDEATYRLFRSQYDRPGQGHVLEALDYVPKHIQRAARSDNPVVRTVAKWTFPFVKTPTMILKQGVEYTPLGVSTLWGSRHKAQQVAKMAIGGATATGVALMLGTDRLTWSEPTEPKEKAEFRAAGRLPYAAKVGDRWVQYSQMHPALGFNFALVAGTADAMKRGKLGEDAFEAIMSLFARHGHFLADQSYMKSVGDIVATTKGDVEGPTRLLTGYTTQLIPFRSMLSWVNQMTDPVQRKADPDGNLLEKQMQTVMAQIPGLSQRVPPRLDPQGRPIANPQAITGQTTPREVAIKLLSPAKTSKVQPSEPEYEKQVELRRMKSEGAKEDAKMHRAVDKFFRTVKPMPEAERRRYIREEWPKFKWTGPMEENARERLVDLFIADREGLTPLESDLRNTPVRVRARAILKALQKMSPADSNRTEREWVDKRIITNNVREEMNRLLITEPAAATR